MRGVSLPRVLTIAGADPSGAAGQSADLKTFHQFGVFGASALTMLAVQDHRGVSDVSILSPTLVAQQIDAVFADGPPSATKMGALGTRAIVEELASRDWGPNLVIDPVLASSSGARLLMDDALAPFVRDLMPRAALITPNLPEAARLAGREEDTARALLDRGARAVLLKGGHVTGDEVVDRLVTQAGVREWVNRRVPYSARGTGCALSAAIAAGLAKGRQLELAIAEARAWLQRALEGAFPGGSARRILFHHAHTRE